MGLEAPLVWLVWCESAALNYWYLPMIYTPLHQLQALYTSCAFYLTSTSWSNDKLTRLAQLSSQPLLPYCSRNRGLPVRPWHMAILVKFWVFYRKNRFKKKTFNSFIILWGHTGSPRFLEQKGSRIWVGSLATLVKLSLDHTCRG